jgi:hypothetical protein
MLRNTLSLVLMLGFGVGCAEATPAATEPNPDPFETIRLPPPNTPPVQQPKAKDEFSTTDRAQAERYLARLHERFQEVAREPNRVVQEEKLAELKKALGELDGKFVTWEQPTRFSQDGASIVLDLPGPRQPKPYQIATTSYGEYLLPDLTTPRLQLGRDLDRDAFRQLKGGEKVKFKAIVGAEVTRFGLNFNLVGRIVEDPFGRPVKYEAFQAKSTWAGQCVVSPAPNDKTPIPILQKYSLKIVVTERTKDSFAGTCTDLKGFRPYAVTGKIDGDKAELTIHRGNDREAFPYFTTFKGTVTDGFVMKGAFEKGTCLFSLMD